MRGLGRTGAAKKDAADAAQTDTTTVTKAASAPSEPRRTMGVAAVRRLVAQVLWALFVVAALFLAVGALLVAVDANVENDAVRFVLDGADALDLGVFSTDNGVMKFTGENAATKNALFNWGLGAIVWLFVGRVVDRLVRP